MKEIVDVKEGADWLLNNRILIHPTDGIWGLGCIATKAAITKIDKLKQRKKNKNYIILFHDIDNALEAGTRNFSSRISQQMPGKFYR